MTAYECDSPELETCLRKLERHVLAGGGYLNDKLIIRVQDGHLSALSSLGPEAKDDLIALPESCLIPMRLAQVVIQDGQMALREKPGLTKLQCLLLEAMLELYNLTNKIAQHKAACVWVACRDHLNVLKNIASGRRKRRAIEKLKSSSRDDDEILLQTYFKTRVFDFRHTGKKEKYPVLMPLTDLLNHHPRGAKYQNKFLGQDQPGLLVANTNPVPGSNECFARYGPYDAYDLFLDYGYVDHNVGFVRSIPLTLDLPRVGAIRVDARIARPYRKKLPGKVNDLRFLPRVTKKIDGKMTVNQLLIPGSQPDALRRVLAFLAKQLRPDVTERTLRSVVVDAALTTVNTNIEFYDGLKSYLESVRNKQLAPIVKNAMAVTDHQLLVLQQHKTGCT